jgi:hypothetical protein
MTGLYQIPPNSILRSAGTLFRKFVTPIYWREATSKTHRQMVEHEDQGELQGRARHFPDEEAENQLLHPTGQF